MLGASMYPPRNQQSSEAMAEWFRDLFESDFTRLALSVLIILSVMPWFEVYALVFFAIFAVELFGRVAVLRDDLRQRSINRVEVLFLVIDVIATLSFLPIEILWDDIRYLRLIRLSRMLLLVGYWGPIAREIWTILIKRERRYQIFFIVASVAILSFIAAVLLYHFNRGKVDDPAQFWTFLWWSFRQIEDPGNMVQDPKATLAFFCSVFLTLSGLFIFSFLVGIATSVVEELVKVGRERRIGLRRHSVICNISPHTRVLLEELVTYYAKSLRSPKIITMGPAERRYNYMYDDRLRRIRYRQGQPLSTHDLQKVDADRARRVILLGNRDREASDSEIVSQILSVREVNPDSNIYAEIYRRDNVRAAQRAGGPRTVPVLADQLVNLFLAKIVAFPGVEPIYTELLTSRGEEIYTCVYDYGAMEKRRRPSGTMLPFGELLERCHRAHGVILLGHLLADERGPTGFIHSLNPGGRRSPDQPARPIIPDVASLRGFFGVASNFTRLREFVDSLPDVSAARRGQGQDERGPVPGFGVCPIGAGLSRLLICGFHDGLIDCCEQLILFCDELEVFVMVPDESHVDRVVETFVERREDGGIPGLEHRVRFTRGTSSGEIDYAEEQHPEQRGRIQIITGDWANENTMLEHPASRYQLTDMDAVLFTYSLGEPDPDARTALGLIKLINLKETHPERMKSDLRIVCEVQNTEKAELFQRRFGRRSQEASSPCHPISIVAAESMRNALMAQAIFVPGIDTIYRELLSEEGEEVCKLLVSDPVDPEMRLTFGQLLATLYQRDDLLLLAVELEDPQEGRRLVVNPRYGSPDYAFKAGELVSIFAIGEYMNLPRATEACPACFSSAETRADDAPESHDEADEADEADTRERNEPEAT